MKNGDDTKDIIKRLFLTREEPKYPHPDGYSNLVKCEADYRHIKPNQKKHFNSFNGTRNHMNCTSYRGKAYDPGCVGPSLLRIYGEKDPIPLRVYDRIYAIVVMARDNISNTMIEFEFMRPLQLNYDHTKVKVERYFDGITRTMYGTSNPTDQGYLEYKDSGHLNKQDVCWAVTDIIHELSSVNMEEYNKGSNWRNGVEIILHYEVFPKKVVGHWFNFDINDDDSIDKKILSQLDIYNFPVCGYINNLNSIQFKYPETIIEQ